MTKGWRRISSDLLFFLFFLFLGDRLFYFGLQIWEKHLVRYDSRLEAFKDSGAVRSYDILVLGTSRTFEGVHPYYLSRALKKNAYKEAYAGKGPRYNYYFYKAFKKHFPAPELVIYGIDYFIFGMQSDRLLQARLGVSREPEDRLTQPLLLLSNKPRFDGLLLRTLVFIEVNCLGRHSGHDRDQAFMATYVGSSERRLLAENRPLRFSKVRFQKFPGKEGVFLKLLLEELQQDHVQVCLLILPDHIGTLKTNSNQRMFRKELQRLSREFRNVFVCDFGDPDLFPVEQSNYFLNGGYGQSNSHLSKSGAALLNELLIRELKKRLTGS